MAPVPFLLSSFPDRESVGSQRGHPQLPVENLERRSRRAERARRVLPRPVSGLPVKPLDNFLHLLSICLEGDLPFVRQATDCARRLTNEALGNVYVSDLLKAREMGGEIAFGKVGGFEQI